MAVGDIFQLSVQGVLDAERYYHTSHFRQLALVSPDSATEQNLIDAWQTAGQTAWLAVHTSAYTLAEVVCRHVAGPTQPRRAPVVEPVALTGTRSAVGDRAAPWLAAVTRLKTAQAGRSRRGRYFVSGFHEGDIVGANFGTGVGTWHQLVVDYAAAVAAVFSATGSNTTWRQVIWSRKLAGAPPAYTGYAGATADRASHSVPKELHSIRSRRLRPA